MIKTIETTTNLAFARRCLTPMIAFCLTFCLIGATGYAQEVPSTQSEIARTATNSGWWSQERAASTTTPHPVVNLAGLKRFGSETAMASTAMTSINPLSAPIGSNLLDMESFGLPDNQGGASLSALPQDSALTSGSLPGLLQTKYLAWEANLSDNLTPVNVNGISVYPFAEISYGRWTVPVSLYISPLRGSN